MKNNLKIIATANGVENALVVVKNNTDEDSYYVSLQRLNHITTNPKVNLVTNKSNLAQFYKAVSKELEGHNCPKLSVVFELECASKCELLRIIKLDTYSYEAIMYYNYRRPKSAIDSVPLSDTDMLKFLGQLELI